MADENLTPEQGLADLAWLSSQFGYYTECALATVEHLRLLKNKSGLKRHEKIADDMVEICRGLGPSVFKLTTPRLKERLHG